MTKAQGSLCKNCKYRFRRVFIPLLAEKYEDDDGNVVVTNGENILISNQCLLTGMDIDAEATIECSKFLPDKNEPENVPFFRYPN